MVILWGVRYTGEFMEERSRVNAVAVVPHSIGKNECALFVHEKIASQLEHVRREAQKPLSFGKELQISPVQRRGQHRASQTGASHTPSSISLPCSVD